MKRYHKIIPAVHLILIQKGKILLLRRFNTGWGDGNYSVIAGHTKPNETVLQAMIREAKEESGIGINYHDLELAHIINRKSGDDARVDFFFKAKKWKGEIKNMEPKKCDDLRWFPINKLPDNIVPYVKQGINSIQNRIFYSEHGWK